MIPVNKQLRDMLVAPSIVIENAGLLLDKYHAECPGQQDQKPELVKVARVPPNNEELRRRLSQHRAALDSLGATRWSRVTSGPLTLQLSRAGSFENAGICLHPVYSFVYLPGTGVKGMTRAFAETVAEATTEDIEAVFGKGPVKDEDSAVGSVVFHDAWPLEWPNLFVDIVNNHHHEYYQGGDHAPDDFEDPIPVCFLAAAAGTNFEFAIGLREWGSGDRRVLDLAREWLDGALTMFGAGAKTNAGYGRFNPVGRVTLGSDFAQFSAELTLETPAFLAGAIQSKEDCELRPATVRGLLRWWWRTLHSAHLKVSELRKMEAKIWGDTEKAGAVGLHMEPVVLPPQSESYDPRAVARYARLDSPPDNRTTLGLLYDSYGMQASGTKSARYYVMPPASWRITVTARTRENEVTADQALDQARLALWLLVRYGGAGAKARRGFGSFRASIPNAPENLDEARRRASAVRPRVPAPSEPVSSSVDWMQERELRLRGNEPWFALDQLGYAYQSFASSEKHRKQKVALGLPRKIHRGPEAEPLRHPAGPYRYSRHSSPLHFHVYRDALGYAVRIAAFASPRLPDLSTSAAYLSRCVERMEDWVAKANTGPVPPAVPLLGASPARGPSVAPRAAPRVSAFKVGDRVAGLLVEKNPKKGTWWAAVDGFLKPGPIQNSKDMPASLILGDSVKLIVKISKPGEPAFTWVTD